MKWFSGRRKKESDLDDEIRSHLRMSVQDRIDRGEDPTKARWASRREFGNVGLIKETTRGMWGWTSVDRMWQDVRYAWRALQRSPGFTAMAVLVIALGIGPVLALVSVVDHVLLRPLPFPDSDRLYFLRVFGKDGKAEPANSAIFETLRRENQVFEEIGGTSIRGVVLTGKEEAQQLPSELMSAEMFKVLGVTPILGRTFLSEEDRVGAEPVAVLGHRLWRTTFASDPDIVGKSIVLDGVPYRAVGVMPESFQSPQFRSKDRNLWLPLLQTPPVTLYGRLKRDVDPATAQAQIDVAGAQIGKRIQMESLYEISIGDERPGILMMFGFTVLVLLIGCANIANLLLARGAARTRDMVMRAAIGASPWRLMRQSIVESLVLVFLGSSAGVLLAVAFFRPLVTMGSPLWQPTTMMPDGRMIAFAVFATLLTTLLCGLLPAFEAAHVRVENHLKEGSRSSEGHRTQRTRSILMITEVALSLTLITGAACLIRSFLLVRPDNPGFEVRNRLVATISLRPNQYRPGSAQAAFLHRIIAGFGSLPGVQSVAASTTVPLSGSIGVIDVEAPANPAKSSRYEAVSESYFGTMGIRLQQGRVFSANDTAGAGPVAVVNEAFARRFFDNTSPLGRTIRFKLGQQSRECTIVGVVDAIRVDVGLAVQRPIVYVPFDQAPTALVRVVIAAAVGTDALVPQIRRSMRDLDPNQPFVGIRTMEETVANEVRRVGPQWQLMTAAALVALLVAAAGMYAVIAYNVSQRTREIGIRITFGARGKDVVMSIMRRGGTLILWGLLFGSFGAWSVVRLLIKSMNQVVPLELGGYVLTAVALGAIGLIACLVPACYALKVDPVVALREH